MAAVHSVHRAFKSQYRHTLEICLGVGLALHLALIVGAPPMEVAPYSLPQLVDPTRVFELDVLPEIRIEDPPPEISRSSLAGAVPEIAVREESRPSIPEVVPWSDPFPPGPVSGPYQGRPSVVETKPVLLKRVEPAYPPLAREAGAEGTVKVQVTIDRFGRVVVARVVESDTIQSLRAAAVDAAYGHLFSPAKQQGHTVSSQVYLTFEFSLR